MKVSIRKQDGTAECRDVDTIWMQQVHGNYLSDEDPTCYQLLLDFGDYCKADEGCCEDPWNCDCDQESRGLVYFRGDSMFITYDGKLPCE